MISLSQFSDNYGIFPYYLITDGYNDFVQFPIHFISEDGPDVESDVIYIFDVPRDILALQRSKQTATLVKELIEVGKTKLAQLQRERDYRNWICLALSESHCFFIDDTGVRESCYLPMGGTLRGMKLQLLAANRRHFLADQPS